jgi:hypothetical protein
VIGFGESKTPEPFKKACSLFIHTDGFGRQSDERRGSSGGGKRWARNELRGDTELPKLTKVLASAFRACERLRSKTPWPISPRAAPFHRSTAGDEPGAPAVNLAA